MFIPAEKTIIWLIGVALILIYAFERFNTPPSNRAMTTAARYYTAASAYMLIYLLAYFLLLNYQNLLNLLLRFFKRSEFQESMPVAVVGAILLSTILPKIPGFAAIDLKLRKLFQTLAAIPIQAFRLSRELYEARFSVPIDFQQKVKEHLVGLGFTEEDLIFEQQDSAKLLWLKNSTLLLELKFWRDNETFSEFFKDRNEQFKRLIDRYQRLTAMALNCFNLVREVNGRETQNPMEQSVRKFYANFNEQADDLFKEICHFASQGILKCQLTHGSRCRKARDMGFEFQPRARPHSLSIHQFLLLYGTLIVLLSVNFIVFFPAWESREKTLIMVSMIVSVYLAAAWCAIILKDKLPSFRRKSGEFPLGGAYLVSGLAAVAAGILISMSFKSLIFLKGPPSLHEAIGKAWLNFTTESYPWMFMAFATAVIISVLADYPPPAKISENRWRVVQAAIQSGLTALSGRFVLWWLQDIVPQGKDLPNQGAVVVVAAAAGAVLGYVVPSWYRAAKQDKQGGNSDEQVPQDAFPAHG